MPDDRPASRSLSIVDSALIVAMVSAVCFIMGHAARIGTANRLQVPFMLMPDVGPEGLILVGGEYLVELSAGGLLLYIILYFVWALVNKRTSFLRAKLGPTLSRLRSRARQHPYIPWLLACLAGASILYTGSVFLLFHRTGGPRIFGGGQAVSDVVVLRLKNSDLDVAVRPLRYLWHDGDIVVLRDKSSGEFLLIEKDEVRLMILKRAEVEHKANRPSNNEMQRTRPARATEPRR